MTIRGAIVRVVETRGVRWLGDDITHLKHLVHFLTKTGELIYEFWSDGLYLPKQIDIPEYLRYNCYEQMKNATEEYRQQEVYNEW